MNEERDISITQQYKNGASAQSLSLKFDISRQRIYQILRQQKTPAGNGRKIPEKYRHLNGATAYRHMAIDKMGGICNNCGFNNRRALQIDHIHGGGVAEYRKLGNHKIYRNIALRSTEGYQVLCANCNWIKRAINKEDIRA